MHKVEERNPARRLRRLAERLQDALNTIEQTELPVIAALHGQVMGLGLELALACDLRVLSDNGYIQEKFVKIGLMPDGGGTFWMPRLVGIGRAFEYLMLGTKIEAKLALEVGLANRVVPADELAVAREGHVAFEDAGAHSCGRHVGFPRVLRELEGGPAVTDGKARPVEGSLGALAERCLQRAVVRPAS